MTNTTAEAIVIGASAGALEALSSILPALPRGYRLPLMIVVHLAKLSIFAKLFRERCRINVVEAEDKEPIRSGTAYFAPPEYHLLVERQKCLSLSNEDPVNFSRPSIDVLFESAADAYGSGLIAIVLTGASSDGAMGLAAVHNAGGTAIVQRPDEAEASMMPEAALAVCPSAHVLSLNEIALFLIGLEAVGQR